MRVLVGLAMGALAATSMTVTASSGHSRESMVHHRIVSVDASKSNNWSGYNQGMLEKGGTTFHEISATWTVPTATAHKAGEDEFSSTWVGIGGGCVNSGCTVTDGTLIQAGTEQDVDTQGRASYSTWWEIIPAPSIAAPLAVKAGDAVHVQVVEDMPAVWTISIQNLTTGQSFRQSPITYTSTHATAEFIEETPVAVSNSGRVQVGPLPNLSTVTFDPGTVNHGSPGLVPAEAIQLVDANSTPLATPSNPDSDADGFNDCAYASSCGVNPS